MNRRLLDWFQRRTGPYTSDPSIAIPQVDSEGGGTPPDDDPTDPNGPANPADPIDTDSPPDNPDDPSGPVNPADPIDTEDPDDPGDPDGPFDPSGPVGPHGIVVVQQLQGGPRADFNSYDREPVGSTPSSFTDPFSNGLIDRWWTVVRGSFLESGDVLSVSGVETSGNPVAVALFNPKVYTDKLSEVTLDGVVGTQYILARMDATGNGYGIKLIGAGGVGNVKFVKLVAWVETVLATSLGVAAFAAGDRLGISFVGTTIKVNKNGAVTGTTLIDATYASGYSGVGGMAASQQWRDFRVS